MRRVKKGRTPRRRKKQKKQKLKKALAVCAFWPTFNLWGAVKIGVVPSPNPPFHASLASLASLALPHGALTDNRTEGRQREDLKKYINTSMHTFVHAILAVLRENSFKSGETEAARSAARQKL